MNALANSAPAPARTITMHCLNCRRVLVALDVELGETVISVERGVVGGRLLVREAELVCACGRRRVFRSAPVGAQEAGHA